jgi:hypothetical protein
MATIGRTLGKVSELTVFDKVRAGQALALRNLLHDLDQGNPFGAVASIHFARFVVLAPDGDDAGAYLLFTCNYDGGMEPFLAALYSYAPLAAQLDTVWSFCEHWAGDGSLAGFRDFVARCGVTADLFYAAYPDLTVADVLHGVRVHSAVQDLLDAVQS